MNNINKVLDNLEESIETVLQLTEKSEAGFHVNLEKETQGNNNFRKVLYTAPKLQLVLMSLKPNEDIGLETHDNTDQFFRVDQGSGKAIIGSETYTLKDGDAVIVPKGTRHNIIAGKEGIKLYTVYAPPHHEDGEIRKTKKAALAAEEKEE